MTMEKIKDVQGLLMEAMTNFAIAENDETYPGADYYRGQVHAYLSVLDEYARLNSPWEKLWHKVLHQLAVLTARRGESMRNETWQIKRLRNF